MDMVRIRASISAGGLRKGQEATVAETPMIAGGIKNGVYVLLERIPLDSNKARAILGPSIQEAALAVERDDPTHPAPDDDPEPVIEDVELPPSADVHDLAEPQPRRRRG